MAQRNPVNWKNLDFFFSSTGAVVHDLPLQLAILTTRVRRSVFLPLVSGCWSVTYHLVLKVGIIACVSPELI